MTFGRKKNHFDIQKENATLGRTYSAWKTEFQFYVVLFTKPYFSLLPTAGIFGLADVTELQNPCHGYWNCSCLTSNMSEQSLFSSVSSCCCPHWSVCVSDEADLSWRCLKLFLAVKIMFCPLSQNKICHGYKVTQFTILSKVFRLPLGSGGGEGDMAGTYWLH